MEENQMKNIVVLKNLPSNIVEEAIIVLKQNKKTRLPKYAKENTEEDEKVKKGKDKNPKEYIIKEAEMVIANYISNIETSKSKTIKTSIRLEKKYKRLKWLTFALLGTILINIFLNI